MWRSNMFTQSNHRQHSKHSQNKSSQPLLRLQSKAKLPGLQSVVNECKAQNQKHSKYKQQQLVIDSQIDQRDTIIKILQEKVTYLEKKLSNLSQKHAQICNMLYQEIEKKGSFQVSLRRQNEQLNKMLKQMMEEANKLVNEAFRGGQQKLILNSMAQRNKQNVNKFNLYSPNKIGNSYNQSKRSRSRKMKLFSTHTKSKTILSSNNEDSGREEGNTAVRVNKICQIQRDYYKSVDKNEMNTQRRSKNHKKLNLLDDYSAKSPIKIIQTMIK